MGTNAKRKERTIIHIAILIVVALAAVASFQWYDDYLKAPNRVTVTFNSPAGAPLHSAGASAADEFILEIADSEAERRKGLMFRREGDLEGDQGMIFHFPDEAERSFWMHNTYIPLDIIFLNSDRKVLGVLSDVPILNDEPRKIAGKSRYVIELLAGTAKRIGLTSGSEARFSKALPKVE